MTSFRGGRMLRTLAALALVCATMLTFAQLALAQEPSGAEPGGSDVFSSTALNDSPLAPTASTSPSGATITSDKADYPPGSSVYLTGAGWAAGENVRIVVNDDGLQDQPWQRDVTVTADEQGNISDRFDLPAWFVANYTVTATGESSGVATTAFTDAMLLTAAISPTSVTAGTSVEYTVTIANANEPPPTDVLGCARITLPTGYTFGSLGARSAPPGKTWTSTYNSTTRVITATATNDASRLTEGEAMTFKVTATAPSTPGSIQWTVPSDAGRRGANCLQAQYTLTGPQPSVIITPACTAASVATHPSAQSITYGDNATFTAAGAGNPAPTVQWQRSTDDGTSWNDVSGATTTTLTVTKPAVSESGDRYRAVFTNTCSGTHTATSDEATLTVAAKNLTVAEAVADDRPYDGTKTATVDFSGASLVGVVGTDDVSIDSTGYAAEFDTKDVGTDKPVTVTGVTLGGAALGNYTVSQPSGLTADITQRLITVTADAQNKDYGDSDPELTYDITDGSLVSGDSFSGALTRDPGEDVGTYAITQGTLELSANYDLSFIGADLTIGPATLSVDADPQSKTYGEDDPEFTYSLSGFQFGEDADSAFVVGAADCSRVSGEDVGGYAITCAPGGLAIEDGKPQNYLFATGASADLTIGPKPLTGSFTAANKPYDGNTSATVTSRSVAVVVGTDDVSLTGGTATFADKNFGIGKTVTLTGATLAGVDKDNYTLSSVNTTTANITPRDLTVTANGVSKEYDGDTAATVTLSTDKVSGDDVTAHYTSASFANKNVGTAKTVSVSGITISGVDVVAGNYNLLNTTETTEAAITARPLTGSFTAANKVFDNNTSATVTSRSLAVVVPLDDVTLTGGTATFNSEDVGTGKPVTLTGATLTGADRDNYTLSSVNTATANITAWSAEGHGFYQPVSVANSVFVEAPAGLPAPNETTVWNMIKGGSTVPLKFNVYAGGVEKTSTSDIGGFTAVKLSQCNVGAGLDAVDFVTTGSTVLRYDGLGGQGGQWIQNWKTPTVNQETCFRAAVTFADGSSLSAFFRVRK
jgi:uncharacterized protein YjbI with pentapeptide repeats